MKKRITTKTRRTGEKTGKETLTIGLDLGDRTSRYCVLDEQGDVMVEGSVATTRKDLDRVLGAMARCRLALEVGTHSPWVSRHLTRLGYEVVGTGGIG